MVFLNSYDTWESINGIGNNGLHLGAWPSGEADYLIDPVDFMTGSSARLGTGIPLR